MRTCETRKPTAPIGKHIYDKSRATAYNADGNVSSITAVNRATGDQLTQYVYGATLSDSDIASSQLKRYEILPDSTGGSDRLSFAYNRQGEVIQVTDQNGTVHAYDYDLLGRKTQDRVTVLGTGVDGAVRRIATTYEVRGMVASVTSYDNATVGSGSVVNQDTMEYDEFGQLVSEAQSHSGAVTGTTAKVQYAYEDGSANTIRQTAMTYPNGRVLSYSYGASGGDNDALSRVQSLVDGNGTTHLAIYSYLGLSTFVETEYAEPTTVCTLIGTTGGIDPDTGDIYRGVDRFGRIKDLVWNNYTTDTDLERVKHSYDRVGNRIWRMNPVDPNRKHDEYYWYDDIHRLRDMERGTLNAANTSILSPTFAQCWSLDATGNWDRFREDNDGEGQWSLIQSRVSNSANEVTVISNQTGAAWGQPAYDPAGNMTSMPQPVNPATTFDLIYDAWNRLVELKNQGGTVGKYEYDGQKRRIIIERHESGNATDVRHSYYTAQWQCLEERTAPQVGADLQFVWGLRYVDDLTLRDRIAEAGLEERLYAMQDPNWNVTGVINPSGSVIERYTYTAYGSARVLSDDFTNRSPDLLMWETLFQGYRYDLSSLCYLSRNRYYNCVIGSWLTRDPLGISAGVNLLQFAFSSPVSLTDPSGLLAVLPAVAAVGGGVAAGTAGLVILGTVLICGVLFLVVWTFGGLGRPSHHEEGVEVGQRLWEWLFPESFPPREIWDLELKEIADVSDDFQSCAAIGMPHCDDIRNIASSDIVDACRECNPGCSSCKPFGGRPARPLRDYFSKLGPRPQMHYNCSPSGRTDTYDVQRHISIICGRCCDDSDGRRVLIKGACNCEWN